MDFFQSVLMGFQVALSPGNLFFCFVGVLIGTLVGVLPGLGPVAAISLLLPTTFHITPVSAVIMLAGIYYGAMYGGSTTSILVNIPGEAASVVTCLDGYQMARQGRAGPALGIAAFGSFIAGTPRRRRPHARGSSSGRNGPEVRPAGIFFPDDRGIDHPHLPGQRADVESPAHGLFRPFPGLYGDGLDHGDDSLYL